MSATAPAQASETEARAPINPPETAPAVAPAVDAARAEAPKPENALTEQPSIMPPQSPTPRVPMPPQSTVGVVGTETIAANDPLKEEALKIEQFLASFMRDRMQAEVAQGIMLDVVLAKSNAVTAEDGKPGQHDIAITFKGGKLEDPKRAQEIAEQLRAAMREHPAFAGMSFGGIDQQIEHLMRCQILSLDAEQLKALETLQPKKHTTFISPSILATPAANDASAAAAPTHACTGAGCAHCAATPAVAEAARPAVPKPEGAAPAQAETTVSAAGGTIEEPVIKKPVIKDPLDPKASASEASTPIIPTKPAEQPKPDAALAEAAKPELTVETPAAHQGIAAANDEKAQIRA